MPTLPEIVDHPIATDENGYRYQFTPKHHGAVAHAAQWLPSLTLDEEFAVFNSADGHNLTDDRGWLYGVERSVDTLRDLGTWTQQIAEFPCPNAGHPWHGYPIWAVNDDAPDNRRGHRFRPDRSVFNKMLAAGLIT
jgi:hypothetical protein